MTSGATPRWLAGFALILGCAASILPWTPGWAALLAGLVVGLGLGNPWLDRSRAASRELLAISVAAMGLGVDLTVVASVGGGAVLLTLVSTVCTMALGVALGRAFGVSRSLARLLAAGTAVCGGSAIAAVAGATRASEDDTAVALATVFSLNALALILFPPIGHAFGLSSAQFGHWAALAIHDTSSVVGACTAYGGDALQIGTTMKLTRALWIAPLTIVLARMDGTDARVKVPWFIVAFVAGAALVTVVPALAETGRFAAGIARHALGLVLFLLGASASRAQLLRVGPASVGLAVTLWVVVSAVSLAWFTR